MAGHSREQCEQNHKEKKNNSKAGSSHLRMKPQASRVVFRWLPPSSDNRASRLPFFHTPSLSLTKQSDLYPLNSHAFCYPSCPRLRVCKLRKRQLRNQEMGWFRGREKEGTHLWQRKFEMTMELSSGEIQYIYSTNSGICCMPGTVLNTRATEKEGLAAQWLRLWAPNAWSGAEVPPPVKELGLTCRNEKYCLP